MKLCIATIIILIIHGVENFEDSPESKSVTGENPSDISAVSKFITDFHKQFEDESLSMARSDFSYSKNNAQEELNKGQKKTMLKGPPKGSQNEKNVTFHVKCKEDRQGSLSVELVNSTRLSVILAPNPSVTSRHMAGDCVVVLFYSRSCPFSCVAAPHFNALPRAFPPIKMAAINAMQHQSYNTQFGIAGVPTLMLFHNGRPAAKFNDSEYTLEMFARFITRYTGLKNVERMYVTSSDFGGPVPSRLAKERDWLLAVAWAVVAGALALGASRSRAWTDLVEAVASAWRDAHEHNY